MMFTEMFVVIGIVAFVGGFAGWIGYSIGKEDGQQRDFDQLTQWTEQSYDYGFHDGYDQAYNDENNGMSDLNGLNDEDDSYSFRGN